jgi:hypothetical protein
MFLLFSALLMVCSLSSVAQQNDNLAAKAQHYANEVFQGCNHYAQPEYLPDYEDILSRMEVLTTSSYTSGYTLLSTVLLKNKCNPGLMRDDASNFDPANFNPLKYNLDYFPKGSDKAYRIDGTSYIIVIHHVN